MNDIAVDGSSNSRRLTSTGSNTGDRTGRSTESSTDSAISVWSVSFDNSTRQLALRAPADLYGPLALQFEFVGKMQVMLNLYDDV